MTTLPQLFLLVRTWTQEHHSGSTASNGANGMGSYPAEPSSVS